MTAALADRLHIILMAIRPKVSMKGEVMFERFFDSCGRVRALRSGPGGALLADFAAALSVAGYAQITARRHIRAAEHLVYWADKAGIAADGLDDHAVSRFAVHLPQCRCPGYGHRNQRDVLHGARLFVGQVQRAGGGAIAATPPATEPALLCAFGQWMREQRGTCEATLDNYRIPLRHLLTLVGGDPRRLDAQGLRQFVLESVQKSGWAAAKKCTTAVRMFLRFLIAEGQCPAGLDAAIPVVAHWRLSSLPRYLPADDVERVIASCNLSTPVGKRDRAILLLLARLGLRAGDIVQLHLADIDWKGAWITVCGKSRRATRFPLTQEVGQAVADYLLEGRPAGDSDAVFVRARAPFRAFASHSSVSVIVEQAMRRAQVQCPSRGAAHVLRHSVAASMLRQGSSFQDIATVLRHRSIETTQIYAKVDVSALRQIAQPWPEMPSC
jgi:integrase/recombinase XerD